MEKTTHVFADGFNEPAGDATKTRCFLIGNSIESVLNSLTDSGDKVVRAHRLSGHVAIYGYRDSVNTPVPVAKLLLVAYNSGAAPASFSSSTLYGPGACTGYEVHSVLADLKVVGMSNQLSTLTGVRMDGKFSYKIPRKVQGVFRSDEHIPEPQLATQLALWIATPSTGYGFEPEDPVAYVGYLDIQYTRIQRSAGLAELI